ncbi:hypothetical protein K488DRAFT_56744 [Vararia minispora EC-137]|uniref:Uncharacterized protein n=1 Tax=Vararia minispora EC-137 TaxID=1314806 RepID=A0ACB8QC08_9AGAM|nr:hypothetical protein K488DRAFT_56744 [Vararia minispora EC-137]
MSFAFVPRSVVKPKAKGGPSRATLVPVSRPAAVYPPPNQPQQSATPDRERAIDALVEDTALLIRLALSDYALWTTPSFRDPNRDGYIPVSALHSSPVLAEITFSEAALVKSIRTHAPDAYDVRMVLASSSKSAGGGYEIRRHDWQSAVARFPTFDRQYWHARTIYLENIPHGSRSCLGIIRLLSCILPNSPRTIQSISFPLHHQDPPDATPKCKGFALLTLSDPSDVSQILDEWPWEGSPFDDALGSHGEQDDVLREGRKAGMRALAKGDWDRLQDEYIAHRAKLLANAASTADTPTVPFTGTQKRRMSSPAPLRGSQSTVADNSEDRLSGLSPSAPFPPGCVARVRGIDPVTNKTALRALFAAPGLAIDYVDYTKGLDYCYFRLSSADHANILAENVPDAGEDMKVEVLRGKQEEVYWEQVPEKVRRQAVEKALAELARRDGEGQSEAGAGDATSAVDGEGNSNSQGKRKRRRRK